VSAASGDAVTCIRSVKHVVHCLDCGETWVDEDEECTCTCSGPGELETWTVTTLQAPLRVAGSNCADCGRPLDGHPGYLREPSKETAPG
jgi:hypothetical protein